MYAHVTTVIYIVHTQINTPFDCVTLLTSVVADTTDETLAVWCTVVDLWNCWLLVALMVLLLIWVVVNCVVMAGNGDEELNASKTSVYN